jgi:hypothetical protein
MGFVVFSIPVDAQGSKTATNFKLSRCQYDITIQGVARWLSPDWAAKAIAIPHAEFSDPQSVNLNSYVRNIPSANYDSDGHDVGGTWPENFDISVGARRIVGAVKAVWHFMTSGPPPHIPGSPTLPPPNCTCPGTGNQNDGKKDNNNNSKSNNQQEQGGQKQSNANEGNGGKSSTSEGSTSEQSTSQGTGDKQTGPGTGKDRSLQGTIKRMICNVLSRIKARHRGPLIALGKPIRI